MKEKKPVMKIKPLIQEKVKKGPKGMYNKIVAKAAGEDVNNGSTAFFKNASQANRAQKMGKSLEDRPGIPPILKIPTRNGGILATFKNVGNTSAPTSATSAKPPSFTAAFHAPAARRERAISSNDGPMKVDDDEEDDEDRAHPPPNPHNWPIMPQPSLKEILRNKEQALQEEIAHRTSAIGSSMPTSAGDTEAAVFSVSRQMLNTLLPARTSNGLVPPSVPIGSIPNAAGASNATQRRPLSFQKPKDPLWVQPTKERTLNQNRVSAPAQRNIAGSPTNAVPQAMSPSGPIHQPAPRTAISLSEYQAQARRPSGHLNATLLPQTAATTVADPRRSQSATEPLVTTQEFLGCTFASLLPHLSVTNSDSLESKHAYFYLLFPASAEKLANTITIWLRASSTWSKVFHCQQQGSWTRFVELTTPKGTQLMGGCLIVHRSLKRMIPKQPLYLTFLSNGNNNVWCADDERPAGQIMQHIFQAGGVVLITPKMFETQPQKVNHLLQWFLKEKLPKTRGKIWRLALLRDMEYHLREVRRRSIEVRKQFSEQYKKNGQTEEDIDRILATKALSKVDIECMFENISLLSHIKQYDLITGAFPGTKEAEPVYIELSSGIDCDDDVDIVDGFAATAILHWEKTRKWIVIGTSGVKSHKGAQKKGQSLATRSQPQTDAEQSAIDKRQQLSAISANANGLRIKGLASPTADTDRFPVTTDENIDLMIFMAQSGVERDVADEYFQKAHGDIGLALKLHEQNVREGAVIKSKHFPAEGEAPPAPHQDGDTNMRDWVSDGGHQVNGDAAPTPPEMHGRPSKQLHAEIASSEMAMEDAVFMIPDTAPPPPPADGPSSPPAKVAFDMPLPSLKRKVPSGGLMSQAPASVDPSVTATGQCTSVDVEMGELTQDMSEVEVMSKFETRPTMEWYAERKAAGKDWKHIWVIGYERAQSVLQIKMKPPTYKEEKKKTC